MRVVNQEVWPDYCLYFIRKPIIHQKSDLQRPVVNLGNMLRCTTDKAQIWLGSVINEILNLDRRHALADYRVNLVVFPPQ